MPMMPSKVLSFSSAQAHYDQLLAEHYDWIESNQGLGSS
jgi:hypothetical protein